MKLLIFKKSTLNVFFLYKIIYKILIKSDAVILSQKFKKVNSLRLSGSLIRKLGSKISTTLIAIVFTISVKPNAQITPNITSVIQSTILALFPKTLTSISSKGLFIASIGEIAKSTPIDKTVATMYTPRLYGRYLIASKTHIHIVLDDR